MERFFRTVRDQFLVEITDETAAGIENLDTLNRWITAWIETVYHPAVHSETGMPPLRRWLAGIADPLPRPSPEHLREAFLWSEFRTVTKTAQVSLHNNRYQVDELLVGRKVELVFDPFDLTDIDVRYGGRGFGNAIAFRLDRHTHPKARPEHPTDEPEHTGIDYLRLLDAAHTEHLQPRINFTVLFGGTDEASDEASDETADETADEAADEAGASQPPEADQ